MNVEGRCESLNIDYKEYYRVGVDSSAFLIIILYYLIIYTFKVVSENNRKLGFSWLILLVLILKTRLFNAI